MELKPGTTIMGHECLNCQDRWQLLSICTALLSTIFPLIVYTLATLAVSLIVFLCFYLFKRPREREGGRKRTAIYWFILQMTTVSGAGCLVRLRPRAVSAIHILLWVAGTNRFSHHCFPPGFALRKKNQEPESMVKPGPYNLGYGFSNRSL